MTQLYKLYTVVKQGKAGKRKLYRKNRKSL